MQMQVDPLLAALSYNYSPFFSPSPSLCAGDEGSSATIRQKERQKERNKGGKGESWREGGTDEYPDIGPTSSNVFAAAAAAAVVDGYVTS